MKAILQSKKKEEEADLRHKLLTGQMTPLAFQWAMKGLERKYDNIS